MFTSIIIISGFTAAIASALTVESLGQGVSGPEDLPDLRVGTAADSTSATYLRGERISFKSFETVPDAMDALAAGQIDAVVYDAPILKYLVSSEFEDALYVVPGTFERQDYAIALPSGSDNREQLNVALLEQITGTAWKDTLYRYLGR